MFRTARKVGLKVKAIIRYVMISELSDRLKGRFCIQEGRMNSFHIQFCRFLSHITFGKAKYRYKQIYKLKKELRRNNRLILYKTDGTTVINEQIKGLSVAFQGKNNTVEIYEPTNFCDCFITLGNGCSVKIESSIYSQHFFMTPVSDGSELSIGKNTSISQATFLLHDEKKNRLIIGEDCMFSSNIRIWPSDGHTIFDAETKEPLNRPQKGVYIGNHVWIGHGVLIQKDVVIPDNCIVGAGSVVVSRSFDETNAVIAGVPAKVVRRGINWSRENTDDFTPDSIEKPRF